MDIKMDITGITVEQQSNMPIIILKDDKGAQTLTVWIGIVEASAIAMELENIKTPRPMTHDLIVNILEGMGARLERIIITELRDNTFYSELVLSLDTREVRIDSRTSDAIAVALRLKAPIYVSEQVLEKSHESSLKALATADDEKKKWDEVLENLDPENFGKYKM
jgi:uncharacterized protein